ncbi:MAG: heparin lyase I family protein [Planctomycetota bacterium]
MAKPTMLKRFHPRPHAFTAPAMALCAAAMAAPTHADVIFEDGFEFGGQLNLTGQSWRDEQWDDVPGSDRIRAIEGAGDGDYGVRFSLFRNDEYVETSNRSELKKDTRPGDLAGMGNNGDTRWYRWNIFVPNDYQVESDSRAFEIVGQLHRAPNAGVAWRSPPLDIAIKEGRWDITNNRDEGNRSQDAGAVVPGTWNEWIVKAEWSPNADGRLTVWKDAQLQWDVTGANTYDTSYSDNDFFLKVGVYKPNWRDTDTQFTVHSDFYQATFVYDDVRVGTENETLASMRTPKSPIPIEVRTLRAESDAQVMGVGLDRHLLNAGGTPTVEVRGNDWNGGEYAAYARFDLSPLEMPFVADATLQLVLESDAVHTLDVYALPDGFAGRVDGTGSAELGELDWLEGAKNWQAAVGLELSGDNAPGFDELAGAPDTTVLELLGSITLDGGLRTDSLVELSTQALIDAVAADTNGMLTLAIFGRDQNGNLTRIRTSEHDALLSPSLEVIGTLDGAPPADFNGDGVVDLLDFDLLASNFQTGANNTLIEGDFNRDRLVDLLDFDGLAVNFGSGSSASAVPEPGGLLAMGALAWVGTRGRKRRR